MPASARRKAEQRRARRVLHLYGLGLPPDEIGRRTRMKPSTVCRLLGWAGIDANEGNEERMSR